MIWERPHSTKPCRDDDYGCEASRCTGSGAFADLDAMDHALCTYRCGTKVLIKLPKRCRRLRLMKCPRCIPGAAPPRGGSVVSIDLPPGDERNWN